MLSVSDRQLEGVLPGDKLALEALDLLEAVLPEVVELNNHALLLELLLLLSEATPGLVVFHLWQSKQCPLHSLHEHGAGDEGIHLGLPDLTEEVQVCSEVLLVCVEPVEGQGAVSVYLQGVVEVLHGLPGVLELGPLLLVFHLDLLPLLLEGTLLQWLLAHLGHLVDCLLVNRLLDWLFIGNCLF